MLYRFEKERLNVLYADSTDSGDAKEVAESLEALKVEENPSVKPR